MQDKVKDKESISGEGEDESEIMMSPNIPYYNTTETSKFWSNILLDYC